MLVSEQEVRSRQLVTSDGSDLTVRLLGSHGGEVMKKEDETESEQRGINE